MKDEQENPVRTVCITITAIRKNACCPSLAALETSLCHPFPCKYGGYCRVNPSSLMRKRRLREVPGLAPSLSRGKAELSFELQFAWLPAQTLHFQRTFG